MATVRWARRSLSAMNEAGYDRPVVGWTAALLPLCFVPLFACGRIDYAPVQSGVDGAPDAGMREAGTEAGRADGGGMDGGSMDGGGMDGGGMDGGSMDGGGMDGGGMDGGGMDGGGMDGAPDAPLDAGPALDAGATCTLTDSPPIAATTDGQVIQGLRIHAVGTGTAGITVNGFSDVTIRNCEVLHDDADGIDFTNAPGIGIEDTLVIQMSAPTSGPLVAPYQTYNINGDSSTGITINRVKTVRGRSGIVLGNCPDASLSNVEVFDTRLETSIEFDASDSVTLDGFFVDDPVSTSFTTGDVLISGSNDCTVQNGVVSGDTDPSGGGVSFHSGSTGGTVMNVDVTQVLNEGFNVWGATGIMFTNTRVRDMLCGDPGRGVADSGGLGWGSGSSAGGHAIVTSSYFNLCTAQIVWNMSDFSPVDVTEVDFTLMTRAPLDFCWVETPY